ncbi:hypothetical protein F0562_013614 [Nyssa sinensis]|uniref:Uncharacterized protein n=1 Tax=Nyssa sinensis TaxID=561372 RepID=A0A5J4ZNW4_9ASTE|nr:hypothetical protein F0562_013614 [Nyssa sinensis]
MTSISLCLPHSINLSFSRHLILSISPGFFQGFLKILVSLSSLWCILQQLHYLSQSPILVEFWAPWKIGYGIVSEALAYKLPFVFYNQGVVEMIKRDLITGHWKPYLERAVCLKPSYEGGINGGEVAARILQDTAIGKNNASDKLSGARRLRDAIVLGYQLQRVPGRDLCIPDWYANAENELGRRTGSPAAEMTENSFFMNSYTEDFEILHGDLQGFSDTMSFLKSLAELDTEEIFVARAPGRLDVMGGIADYSGSLVLQDWTSAQGSLLCFAKR